MHQSLRLLAALLVLLLVAGCSSVPRLSVEAEQLPERVELTEVPFFPQAEYQCGPAALASMLTQRGVATSPGLLKERVFLPGRQGSLQVELVAAARGHDLLVYPLAPRLDAVLAEVAAGNPVLVLQNLAFDWYPRWHFAVVVGYDRGRQQLILRSGITRRWLTDFASFDATWARSGRWAVLTLPPEQMPARAELRPWLQAAVDLEQTGHAGAAVQAYRAAVQRWPEQGMGWFALGNALYAAGDSAAAQRALLQAVRVEPQLVPAWSNLAHVLGERGCTSQARLARECAALDARSTASPVQGAGSGSCPGLPACPY